ncbi:uncharacterized protein BXZ73DRAFT_9966, partial [Epithele typhae]|uniref:uncharacterized protein n=1 Tax=Epithele typhae TaxID=378194 RepID=UPI0020088010
LNNDSAALVGVVCEAVLWGFHVAVFAVAIGVFCRKRRWRSVNHPICILNCILFTSCTAHFVLEFDHYIVRVRTEAFAAFADETSALLGADLLISVSDFLGGVCLLYRCWVIWGRNFWIVLLPLVSGLAGLGCIAAVAYILLTLDPSAPVAPAALVPLGLAGYALPLLTNAAATALVVARLLVATRRAHARSETGRTARAARRALAAVVESGALYLAAQAAFVVLFALGHPAQAVAAAVAAQV